MSERAREFIGTLQSEDFASRTNYGTNEEIQVMWAKGTYKGELNDEGQAHGHGTFTTIYKVVYSGTFYENEM